MELPLADNRDTLGLPFSFTIMKVTDDYRAKYRLWAQATRTVPAGAPLRIPGFKSARFATHAEMNAWKTSVLRLLAQASRGNG